MLLRLRQICLVSNRMEHVIGQLTSVFGIKVCHIDNAVHKYGLENRLMPIGNQLLEVVAPIRDGTAAGRYIERRGGDGGYMVITQCDDVSKREDRVNELGIRVANRLEHDDYSGLQLHPQDTRGTFFEIDQQLDSNDIDGPWHPAGPRWQQFRSTDVVDAIRRVDIQSDDPKSLAQRWSEIAEIDLDGTDGDWVLPLENAEVGFVSATDGRPEGLSALHLSSTDAQRAYDAAAKYDLLVDGVINICGTRFHLT